MLNQFETINRLYKFGHSNQETIKQILDEFSKHQSIEKEAIYEYSIAGSGGNFKLLHLLFYGALKEQDQISLYQERKKEIQNMFLLCRDKGFNFNLLSGILDTINEPAFPIQIAFEFSENELLKIKIYFSNTDKHHNNLNSVQKVITKLSEILQVKKSIKYDDLLGDGIDSIGIDFLANSETKLKIYTYFRTQLSDNLIKKTIIGELKKYNINQSGALVFLDTFFLIKFDYWGFLYRISNKGELQNVKVWFKLSNQFIKIKEQKFNLSYITIDENVSNYIRPIKV